MLDEHKKTLTSLTDDSRRAIRDHLDFEDFTQVDTYKALLDHEMTQADVVMILLRAGSDDCRADVARLIGQPIEEVPAQGSPPPPKPVETPRGGANERSVIRLKTPGNPRYSGTRAHADWERMRDGMTVAQYLVRGGLRRTLREAAKQGWVRIEKRRDT